MSMLVPPKNWETIRIDVKGVPNNCGMTAITVREDGSRQGNAAHGAVQEITRRLPGPDPGIYPPYFFKSSEICSSLNWVATQKYEKNMIIEL